MQPHRKASGCISLVCVLSSCPAAAAGPAASNAQTAALRRSVSAAIAAAPPLIHAEAAAGAAAVAAAAFHNSPIAWPQRQHQRRRLVAGQTQIGHALRPQHVGCWDAQRARAPCHVADLVWSQQQGLVGRSRSVLLNISCLPCSSATAAMRSRSQVTSKCFATPEQQVFSTHLGRQDRALQRYGIRVRYRHIVVLHEISKAWQKVAETSVLLPDTMSVSSISGSAMLIATLLPHLQLAVPVQQQLPVGLQHRTVSQGLGRMRMCILHVLDA